MKVVVVGAGGHAHVVADILQRSCANGSGHELMAFVDDDPNRAGERVAGVEIVGGVECLADVDHDAVIVAIGDNDARRRMTLTLERRGEQLLGAIHPTAILSLQAYVERGTVICAGAIVNPATGIGVGAIVNTACSIDHHNHIADYVHVAPGAHLGGGVWIGEGTLIGIGATVSPGVRIGAWCVIGAGAVVNRDLPDRVVAYGVPAKIVSRCAPCQEV